MSLLKIKEKCLKYQNYGRGWILNPLYNFFQEYKTIFDEEIVNYDKTISTLNEVCSIYNETVKLDRTNQQIISVILGFEYDTYRIYSSYYSKNNENNRAQKEYEIVFYRNDTLIFSITKSYSDNDYQRIKQFIELTIKDQQLLGKFISNFDFYFTKINDLNFEKYQDLNDRMDKIKIESVGYYNKFKTFISRLETIGIKLSIPDNFEYNSYKLIVDSYIENKTIIELELGKKLAIAC